MFPIRYLLSFVGPLSAFYSLSSRNAGAWMTAYFVFLLIPFLDLVLGRNAYNLTREEESISKKQRFYNWMLYLHVPLQLLLFFYFGWTWNHAAAESWVKLGWIVSVALTAGGIGITVAHELVHRPSTNEQWGGKFLLMTVLYMHFSIEHVRGHHYTVATKDDPATARKGKTFYGFLFPSIVGQLFSAWKLERRRLKKGILRVWSWRNEMIQFAVLQTLWVVSLGIAFGWRFLPAYLATAFLSFSLLELINYVEHYGLERKPLENGRYEVVNEKHSWNSDHAASRGLLFELTRHADHHAVASRPYPILRSHPTGPQLPTGYPGMVVLALVPPLFFWVMHRRLKSLS